jgi:hypothetical protein
VGRRIRYLAAGAALRLTGDTQWHRFKNSFKIAKERTAGMQRLAWF